MSSGQTDSLRTTQRQEEDWGGRYSPATREDTGGAPWGLIVTGLVIGGLAALAWNYFGPDLRRYIKISNM
jgi:ABC-type dipeptide/oligopeptide/nickel transport system permease subunit